MCTNYRFAKRNDPALRQKDEVAVKKPAQEEQVETKKKPKVVVTLEERIQIE